jgi:cytochrome c5
MTDISDAQVREIQWASSDEGKAQLRAAWAEAVRLGLYDKGTVVAMADVSALLWAAREAVPPPAGMATVLSGCQYCHRVIARAGGSGDGDEWRVLPDRAAGTQVLFPAAAVACAASPDDRHHPPEPGRNSGALRHLGEM